MSTPPPKAHRAEAPTDIIADALEEAKALFQECGGLNIDTIKARYLKLINKSSFLRPLLKSELEVHLFAAAVQTTIKLGLPWNYHTTGDFVNLFNSPGAGPADGTTCTREPSGRRGGARVGRTG